ncbi:FAD-linked oxidoreductase [Rhodanobacter sp. B05]|uniref:FAD-dependent oxidoreductase n=1 Tax=Rhodanobacter sp. B05 TaxID=1945859 RepID=UPI000986EC7D|nr:FAD-dependent oxidoreductase [Rhodanobacter sp. B05]OOG58240.1 FAD-linked oxidoreductase [Rhodanobacter sp. B05]
MNRRDLLKATFAASFLPLAWSPVGRLLAGTRSSLLRRVGPGDRAWPAPATWEALKQRVGGRLLKLQSPFAPDAPAAARAEALQQLKNPFYLGDQPALTQTSGWADAWTSRPSAYAVAAESAADVAVAVNFARDHRLRLVVKGGGHSYQGTSDAPDSLLIWTRRMNHIQLHDAFVPKGCYVSPQPAVSIGAGAMWIDAYDAVTTKGGRYVQGGGCTSVGVAGLVQSGGFGSFSKHYGTAAAGLIEAEVVTADGKVCIANACSHPELFWGLKGGGGGSLGVVTRLTLRTRELPETFGGAFGAIKASSDAAYRALIARAIEFYRSDLFNPHWGEQLVFQSDNTMRIAMVFHGLTQVQAQEIWAPFLAWVGARKEYTVTSEMRVFALPARHFWDAEFFRQHAPQLIAEDGRPGAPRNHMLWAGDQGQVGWFLHGYRSAWLPASLLQPRAQARLVDAMFAASRAWGFALHFNKGLAGAPPEAITAARDTATHPGMVEAFALAICASGGAPAFPGMPGPGPDLAAARRDAAGVGRSMDALLKVAPQAGSYVSESDYFKRDWQDAFWGTNYPRLAAVKRRYDPDGLFFVHHGVGSEDWSEDGFARQ